MSISRYLKKESNTDRAFLSLCFITPITPPNLVYLRQGSISIQKQGVKVFVKQSLVIALVAARFISFAGPASNDDEPTDLLNVPTYFIAKKRSAIITVTRAPIAHKKFSRTQYFFVFYEFKINFSFDYVKLPSYNFFKQEHERFFFMKRFFQTATTPLFAGRRITYARPGGSAIARALRF